jgi:hypothetical protein
MKKHFIDFAAGLGLGLLFLVVPYFLPGIGGAFGFDVVAAVFPALPSGMALFLALVFYLLLGLVLFWIYSLTPFYRKRHEGRLGIVFSFVSFFLGIVLSFLVLVALAEFALSMMNPALP